ncbi:hypothetical protein B296_00038580 [Ensete ventricosum]|uniref:Uncharacterized protein n=1 Tax=Ensete ventricosum TaxID=4639 RepID=A0A426XE46_ENSVE|nr:hypothetical protein B296_00038580 [Ensete ventricosum]
MNSGTNPGDLIETVTSGTNPGDLAERVNSSTNPRDLAERANSGINPGDLAERVNSGTNLGDLVERANSGTNPRDLAKRVGMTSSDSSSSIRVVSSPGSGEASRCDPEVSSSGASSRPPSPIDARVQRDLEVKKADQDLEGGSTLKASRLNTGCMFRSPGNAPTVRTLPTFWGFRLYWSAHPISNASPYLSEEESVLVGRLKGIISSSCAIKEMTKLWLVEAGLNPTSRDQMDLGELRGMPKVSGGKAPPTRLVAREVDASPAREAPKALSKRPVDAPTEQADDSARRHKKVKVLTRRHKSRHGEGESRSRSKGKELVAPSEEPDTLVESEGGASPVHHRPRSMKDLFKTKMKRAEELDESLERLVGNGGVREGTSPPQLARELYTLPSEVLLARATKEMILVSSQLDALKSGGAPEAVAKAEECASELQKELEKTRREQDEALLRREVSKKELNEGRSNLAEVQRLLKEARVRARKMDDELLQVMKALESVRAELPKQAVIQYKESLGFKEGLKRMGRGHLQVRVSGGVGPLPRPTPRRGG